MLNSWELTRKDRADFKDANLKGEATVPKQLNRAFRTLRKLGFDARRNAADCRSCIVPKNEERYVFTIEQGDKDTLQRKRYGYTDPDPDAWVHLYWRDADCYREFEDDAGTMQQYQQPDEIIAVLKANGLIVKQFNSNNYKTMQDESIAIHSSGLINY